MVKQKTIWIIAGVLGILILAQYAGLSNLLNKSQQSVLSSEEITILAAQGRKSCDSLSNEWANNDCPGNSACSYIATNYEKLGCGSLI